VIQKFGDPQVLHSKKIISTQTLNRFGCWTGFALVAYGFGVFFGFGGFFCLFGWFSTHLYLIYYS